LHARLLSEANEADVSRLYLSLYDQLGVGWNDLQHLIAGAQHGADRRKPYVLHDTLGRRPKLRPAQLIFALLTHLDGRDELLLGLGQLRLQLLHVAVAAIHDLSRELRRLTLEAKDLGAAYVPRLEQRPVHAQLFADERMQPLEGLDLLVKRSSPLLVQRPLVLDELRILRDGGIELQRPVIELRLDTRLRRPKRRLLAPALVERRLRPDDVELHEQLAPLDPIALAHEDLGDDALVGSLHDLDSSARDHAPRRSADLVDLGPMGPHEETANGDERDQDDDASRPRCFRRHGLHVTLHPRRRRARSASCRRSSPPR